MEERPLAPDEAPEEDERRRPSPSTTLHDDLSLEDLPELHLHLENEEDHELEWKHHKADASSTVASDRHSPTSSSLDVGGGDDERLARVRGEDEGESDGDDGDGLVFEAAKLGFEADGNSGRKLSHRQLCGLALYWFARSAWWTAFTILLLPLQARALCAASVVLEIAGDEYKGTAVGVITLTGAVLSLVAYPIVGILSDRTQVKKHHRVLPVGRRMPYMVVGVPLMAASMLAFPFLEHRGVVWLVPYAVAYLSIQLFDAVAAAPYLALVPDIVAQAQFGVASGWLGLMSMLGNLFGGGVLGVALNGLTNYGAFFLLALAQIVCLLGTVFSVAERPSIIDIAALDPDGDRFSGVPPPSRRLLRLLDWIREALRPFKDPNFRWVFWTRFLFTAGFQIIIQFLQYFMRDAVPSPYEFAGLLSLDDPEAAVSFFVGLVTLGSVVSALLSGYLSDRYGRKVVVYVAGAMMALIPLVMIVTNNFTIMILSGFVFGLAYGAYITVDFALASDVLPRSESHATDLGVWHMSWVLPTVALIKGGTRNTQTRQMITPPIAGLMIDLLEPHGDVLHLAHLGYKSAFLLASVLLLAAVVLVRQIRSKVEELGGPEVGGGIGQEMRTLADHDRAPPEQRDP